MDRVILGAGAAALGGVAALGGLAGDQERVTQMWVGAALDETGAAAVTEVIDYDFGFAADRHGIFRTIPGLTTSSPVVVASSSAPDGIAAKTSELVGGEPGIKLKIGDPNLTINGRHRYEIGYTHPGLVRGSGLSWDAVGAAWTVPVSRAEVHVVAPWQFTNLTCSTGATGATGGCELLQPQPGHLLVTVSSLDANEGVTIQATRGEPIAAAPALPVPPLDAPPDPGAGLAKPATTAALAGLGAAAIGSGAVRRRGRERVGPGGASDAAWAGDGSTSEVLLDHADLADMATTEFAPPEGIRAAQGGVVLAEAVRTEHKVAWLIEAAIDGSIELVEEDGKPVRLLRPDAGAGASSPILDQMFGGRSQIELGSYDPTFATGWGQVGGALETWRASSGLWDPGGDRRRTIVRVLGGVAVVVGAIGVAATAMLAARWSDAWLPPVAVAAAVGGLGFAAAVRGWELSVRTPAGSAAWLRVESFRRFLAASESYHAEEAAKRGVLREYTAWAVAVGEIDRWERAVRTSSAIPSSSGVGFVHMAPLLLASTSSTATAPSSSGSGGGGGSVGGGGGGGGGGSW